MGDLDNDINDMRTEKDFKGYSFSKFKKSEVKKELLNSLNQSKIEPSCYWSCELICAGHYVDLWEIILLFFSKYIHLSNAKISIYLEMRINDFKTIVNNGYSDNLLRLRNNEKIRKLFCEVMCILCYAKRRHSFDSIKIDKDEMNLLNIKDQFKAPNMEYGEEIFTSEDPKELFPFINELAYNVSEQGNNQMLACYWIEWIIEYEYRCKCKNEKIVSGRRTFASVDSKYQKQIIWVIWDIFLTESKKRSKIIQKIVEALLFLFSFKYTVSCYKKRKNILYYTISILCEHVVFEKELICHSHTDIINNVKQKIDSIYKQIKKNEESTDTDYLFLGMKSSNLENTIKKLETMNSFGESFIPRL